MAHRPCERCPQTQRGFLVGPGEDTPSQGPEAHRGQKPCGRNTGWTLECTPMLAGPPGGSREDGGDELPPLTQPGSSSSREPGRHGRPGRGGRGRAKVILKLSVPSSLSHAHWRLLWAGEL